MKLTIDDLQEVRECLFSIRVKWYDIGIELRIGAGELDTIRTTYSDPKDGLTEMIKKWLKSSKHGPPTWKVLAKALQAEAVDEKDIAEKGKEAELYAYDLKITCMICSFEKKCKTSSKKTSCRPIKFKTCQFYCECC